MTSRARQGGAALMAMLLVVIVGGAWWLVSGLKAAGNRTGVDRVQNSQVLALAKDALIGHVVSLAGTTDLNPGRLPCPEAPGSVGGANEGIAAGSCTLPAVGRLPWRTLGIDKLQDAAGEPLWYVVSAGWAYPDGNTRTLGINSNTPGNLTVNGTANAAVAMIVAPGAPMVVNPNANQLALGCLARTQARTPSAPVAADYLECQSGASVRTTVVDNTSNRVFNDQAVVVTAAEVLSAVEPVVAVRIEREVVPAFKTAYASSTWGSSAANPVYPFAATFSDPAASTFKGTAGNTQGLLPLNTLTCSTLTGLPCDPSFHSFVTGSAVGSVVADGPLDAGSPTCSIVLPPASVPAKATCSFSFTRICVLLCFYTAPTVQMQVDITNIGRAMRSLNGTAPTGLFGATSFTGALQSDGSARLTYSGNMNTTGSLLCGPLISLICSGTATATITLGALQDNSFVTPTGPDYGDPAPCPATPTCTTTSAWFWFIKNKWHYVTYYAVAPLHTPGSAGNCAGATCLSVKVQGGTNMSDKQALLVLAGRSVNGTTGSNRTLTDFLDGSENTNSDRNFEQYKANNRSFNDRFVAISP